MILKIFETNSSFHVNILILIVQEFSASISKAFLAAKLDTGLSLYEK